MKNWFTAIGGLSLAATVFIGGTAMKSPDTDPIKTNSITVADSLVDTTALVWGIDLSHHQRNVDWDICGSVNRLDHEGHKIFK